MGAAALAFAATLTPAHANEAPVTCAVEIRNETPALQPAFQEALSQWNQALAGSGLQFVDAPSGPNVVTVRTATNEQMVAASGRNTSPPSGLGHGTGPNGPGRVLINENSYQPGAATDVSVALIAHEIGHVIYLPHLADNSNSVMAYGYTNNPSPVTPSINRDDLNEIDNNNNNAYIKKMYCPNGSISATRLDIPNRVGVGENKWIAWAQNKKGAYVYGNPQTVEEEALTRVIYGKTNIKALQGEGLILPALAKNLRAVAVSIEQLDIVNKDWIKYREGSGGTS
jgi:hypothetical protein